jgi:hypothetical protein
MREFITKPREPGPGVEFSVDGREMTFHTPGWAPIVLMRSSGPLDVTRTYLDWLGAGLPDEDAKWLLDRLLDPTDDFDLPEITDIIMGLMEEVTGRPIQPPTDSTPSEATADSTDGRRPAELTLQS